jgi:glutaredoxin-like protein
MNLLMGLNRLLGGERSESTPHVAVVSENEPLIVYGTTWCGDCYRSKRFLDTHHVPYTWVDIGNDPRATQVVMTINRGRRSVPTIVFPDGSTLTEPSNRELGQKLGLV